MAQRCLATAARLRVFVLPDWHANFSCDAQSCIYANWGGGGNRYEVSENDTFSVSLIVFNIRPYEVVLSTHAPLVLEEIYNVRNLLGSQSNAIAHLLRRTDESGEHNDSVTSIPHAQRWSSLKNVSAPSMQRMHTLILEFYTSVVEELRTTESKGWDGMKMNKSFHTCLYLHAVKSEGNLSSARQVRLASFACGALKLSVGIVDYVGGSEKAQLGVNVGEDV